MLKFEKRPMLYNWIYGCHGSMCYVIVINVCFCNVHSIIQSMCMPILRSIGAKLTKAKIVCFI